MIPASASLLNKTREAFIESCCTLAQLICKFVHTHNTSKASFTSAKAKYVWSKCLAKKMLKENNMVVPLLMEIKGQVQAEYKACQMENEADTAAASLEEAINSMWREYLV